jgi:TPR repeat protein
MRSLVIGLVLAGCAMSESDCRSANWYQRGERDGYGGHPPQDMRLAQQCARYGVAVPRAYQDGWAVGHNEHDRLRTMNDP